MTTSIHVLCSNFTKIALRKVGETMHCFGDKKFTNWVFSAPFCARLAEGATSLQGRVPRDYNLLISLPVKVRPIRFRFAGVSPKKWFRTIPAWVGLQATCILLLWLRNSDKQQRRLPQCCCVTDAGLLGLLLVKMTVVSYDKTIEAESSSQYSSKCDIHGGYWSTDQTVWTVAEAWRM